MEKSVGGGCPENVSKATERVGLVPQTGKKSETFKP